MQIQKKMLAKGLAAKFAAHHAGRVSCWYPG
jgi:hypothetical protein